MAVTLADSGSQGRARQHDQLQLMGHTADGSDSTIGGTGGSGTGGSGGSGGSGGGSTVVVTSEHLALNLGPQPYVASAPAMIAPLGTTPAAHTASAAEGELRALGLTRHQLYVRMRKYGFD